MESLKIIDSCVKELLQDFPKLQGIYVFGSFGTEYERPDSDLDLAILSKERISAVELWEFSQKLAAKFNVDIDLINLAVASTVFRYVILSTGKRIYAADASYCNEIENLYMSMYLRFKDERAELIQSLQG